MRGIRPENSDRTPRATAGQVCDFGGSGRSGRGLSRERSGAPAPARAERGDRVETGGARLAAHQPGRSAYGGASGAAAAATAPPARAPGAAGPRKTHYPVPPTAPADPAEPAEPGVAPYQAPPAPAKVGFRL